MERPGVGKELAVKRSCGARVLGLVLVLAAGPGWADEAADFFRQSCFSCHTIGGGRLTGPDLKDVLQRRDRTWLQQFIPNPAAMINGGDAYAAELAKQAKGVIMPTVAGLNPARVNALIDLLEAESKLPESAFKGLAISDAPFTPTEIAAGRDSFLGSARLKNRGPACVSCHTTAGLSTLGGGRLAPDLTRVIERLGSRKALAAWLQAPATPVMSSVFKPKPLDSTEILPLVAFLESSAQQSAPADALPVLRFFLLGLAAAVLLLLAFDQIWRTRFRSVRRALVNQVRSRAALIARAKAAATARGGKS